MLKITHAQALFAVGALASAMLTGCANQPMRVALTEMGTSSDSEYGLISMRLQRGVTITGLGADETVGTTSSDSDAFSVVEQFRRLWPTRSDLPDTMSPRLTQGKTEVRVRTLGTNASSEDLMELRDVLQRSEHDVAELARAQLKVLVLQAAKAQMPKAPTSEKAEAKEAAQAEDEKRLQALRRMFPDLVLSSVSDVDVALEAAKQVQQALGNGNSSSARLRELLRKSGVIVTQWQAETKLDANLDTTAGSVGGGGSRSIGGYLILAGIQVHTLYIGDDIALHAFCRDGDKRVTPAPERRSKVEVDKCIKDAFSTSRQYVTTYQVRARHLLYTESLRSATHLGLRVRLDEIAALAGAGGLKLNAELVQKIKADADLGYAAVRSAASAGALDAGLVSGVAGVESGRLIFTLEDIKQASPPGPWAQLINGSVPVINMRVALKDYLKDYVTTVGK